MAAFPVYCCSRPQWNPSNAIKLVSIAFILLFRTSSSNSVVGASQTQKYTLGQPHKSGVDDGRRSGTGRERRLRRKERPDRMVRKGPRPSSKSKSSSSSKSSYRGPVDTAEDDYEAATEFPLFYDYDKAADVHDVEEYVDQEFHYNRDAKKNDKGKLSISPAHKGDHLKTKHHHKQEQTGEHTKTKVNKKGEYYLADYIDERKGETHYKGAKHPLKSKSSKSSKSSKKGGEHYKHKSSSKSSKSKSNLYNQDPQSVPMKVDSSVDGYSTSSSGSVFQSTVLLELDPDAPSLSRTQSHALEQVFLETYNSLSDDMCDPLGRELVDVRIVVIDNTSLLVHARGECFGGCDSSTVTLFSEPTDPYFQSLGSSLGYITSQRPPPTLFPAFHSDPRTSLSPNGQQVTWNEPTPQPSPTVGFSWLEGDNLSALHHLDSATERNAQTESPSKRPSLFPTLYPSTSVPTSSPSATARRIPPTLSAGFGNVEFDLEGRHYLPRKPRTVPRPPKLQRSADAGDIGSTQDRYLSEASSYSYGTRTRSGGGASPRTYSAGGRHRGLKGDYSSSKSSKSKSGKGGCKSKKSKSVKSGYDAYGCCDNEYASYRAPTELEFTASINAAIVTVPELTAGDGLDRQGPAPYVVVLRTIELKEVMCSVVEEIFDSALLVQFVGDQDLVTENQIREVEQAIKDTYISLQSTRCDDPFFRQLDDVQQRGITAGEVPGTFIMEFLLRGTCRGLGCSRDLVFFDSDPSQRRRLEEDTKTSFLSYMTRQSGSMPDEESLCLCPVFLDEQGPPSIFDFTDRLAARIDELHNRGDLPGFQASLNVFEEDSDFMLGLQREPYLYCMTVEVFGDADFVTMEEIRTFENTVVEVYNDLQAAEFCDPLSRIFEAATLTFFNPTPNQDTTFDLSFQIDASCLGRGCRETATLFSDGMQRRLQMGEMPPECQPGQEPRAPTELEYADALNRRIQQLFQEDVFMNIMGSESVMQEQCPTRPPSEAMGGTFTPTMMPTFMDVETSPPTPQVTTGTPQALTPTQNITTQMPTIAPSNVGDTIRPTAVASNETLAPTGLRGTVTPTGTGSSGEITFPPSMAADANQTAIPTVASSATNQTAAPTTLNGTTIAPTIEPAAGTPMNGTAAPSAMLGVNDTVIPTVIPVTLPPSALSNQTAAPSAGNLTTQQPSTVGNETTFAPSMLSANATVAPTVGVDGNQTTAAPSLMTGNQTEVPTLGGNVTLAPTLLSGNETSVPTLGNATTLEPTSLNGTTTAPTVITGNETSVPTLGNVTIQPTTLDGNQTSMPTLLPGTNGTTFAPTLLSSGNETIPPTIVGGNQTSVPTVLPGTNDTLVPTVISNNMTTVPTLQNGTIQPTLMDSNGTTSVPTVVSGNQTQLPGTTLQPTSTGNGTTNAPSALLSNNTAVPSSPAGSNETTQAPSLAVNGTLLPTASTANGTMTLAPSVGNGTTQAPSLLATTSGNESLTGAPTSEDNASIPGGMIPNGMENGTTSAPSVASAGNETTTSSPTLGGNASIPVTQAPSLAMDNGTVTGAPSLIAGNDTTSTPTIFGATNPPSSSGVPGMDNVTVTGAPSIIAGNDTATTTSPTTPGATNPPSSSGPLAGTGAPSLANASMTLLPTSVLSNETQSPSIPGDQTGITGAPTVATAGDNSTTQAPTVATANNGTTLSPSVGASAADMGTTTPTVAGANTTMTQAPSLVTTANDTTMTPSASAADTGTGTTSPTLAAGVGVTGAPSVATATANDTTVAPTGLDMMGNVSGTNETTPGMATITTPGMTNVTGRTGGSTVDNDYLPATANIDSGASLEPTQGPTFFDSSDTLMPSSESSAGSRSGTQASCSENPKEITTGVTIELIFPDDIYAACTDADLTLVLETIEETFNFFFPSIVQDWEGMASFGTFHFDKEQHVDNTDPSVDTYSNRPIRRGWSPHRHLEEGCPIRPTICPLAADACFFACGIAKTTNCGSGDTSNWPNLGPEVAKDIASLELPCMGYPNDPLAIVNVFTDEPVVTARRAPPQSDSGDTSGPDDFFDTLWGSQGSSANARGGTESDTATRRKRTGYSD